MERVEFTYTPEEAAKILGCSPLTLRRWARHGEVPHHRRGRVKGVFFTEEDVQEIRTAQARPVVKRDAPVEGPESRFVTAPVDVPARFAVLRKARRI